MNNYTSLIDALIHAENQGNPQHEKILVIGKTPTYLIEHANFLEKPLIIKGKTVGKIHFDHGITASILKRLPSIIDNPKGLYKPANLKHHDSVVVLTLEIKGNAPIIVPIRRNVSVGRNRNCCNEIVSAYGKEGVNPENRWKNGGLLMWEP